MKFNLSAGLWLNFRTARSPKSFLNRTASRSLSPLKSASSYLPPSSEISFETSGRSEFSSANAPRNWPSIATKTALFSTRRASTRAAEAAHVREPSRIVRPATSPSTPQPGVSLKFATGSGALPSARAIRTELGCVDWRASDPIKSASRAVIGFAATNSTPRASAIVSVPVLSKTIVSTSAMRSMTSALFRKIFSRARIRCAVPCVSGAASASAHGHATISTETKALSAFDASAKIQNTAAASATPMTSRVKRLL